MLWRDVLKPLRLIWHWLRHTLGGRLSVVFLGVVMIAMLSVLVVWRYYSLSTIEGRNATLLVSQIRAVILAADQIGDHPARLREAFDHSGLRILIDTPAPYVVPIRPVFERQISEMVSTQTGMPVKLVVRILSPRAAYVSFPWRAHQLVLIVPMDEWEAGFPSPLMTIMLVVVALTFSLGLLSVLWLQRPLKKLAGEIASHRAKPVHLDTPKHASEEVQAVIHAYNRVVEEITAREREREQILGGVSHDLKAPLARLRMRASMVGNAHIEAGIVRDIESLNHIAEQFLSYVRSGAEDVPGASCSLGMLFNDLCQRYGHRDLAVEITPDLPAVACSLRSAERILTNLLENAFEYGTPPVRLCLRRDGDAVSMSVSDKGPGIPADQFANAIEPFVRLDAARGLPGHSGLGLAIVNRLAQYAGGHMFSLPCGEQDFEIGVRLPLALPRPPTQAP